MVDDLGPSTGNNIRPSTSFYNSRTRPPLGETNGSSGSTSVTLQKTRSPIQDGGSVRAVSSRGQLSRQTTATTTSRSTYFRRDGSYPLVANPVPLWVVLDMIEKDKKATAEKEHLESSGPRSSDLSGMSRMSGASSSSGGGLNEKPVFRIPRPISEKSNGEETDKSRSIINGKDISDLRPNEKSPFTNNEIDTFNDNDKLNNLKESEFEQLRQEAMDSSKAKSSATFVDQLQVENDRQEYNPSPLSYHPEDANSFSFPSRPISYRDYKRQQRQLDPSHCNYHIQQLIALSARPQAYVDDVVVDQATMNKIFGDSNKRWFEKVEAEREARLLQERKARKSRTARFRRIFHAKHSASSSSTHSDNETRPFTMSSARYLLSVEARKTWQPKLTRIFLNNPFIPLTLRAIIFILSVLALAISSSIYVRSHNAQPAPITQEPSTIMAIVVQSTALVYLVYITYDEYSGAPLGLRDARAKMRLIMLDLLFIIFSAANLSLTFNTLYDRTWVCQTFSLSTQDVTFVLPYISTVCRLQKALASFLFMILVMWILTFTISIFRLVERVAQ